LYAFLIERFYALDSDNAAERRVFLHQLALTGSLQPTPSFVEWLQNQKPKLLEWIGGFKDKAEFSRVRSLLDIV